jgi:hypothetical protein
MLVQNGVEVDLTYGSLARTALYDSKAGCTLSLVFVNAGAPPLPVGAESHHPHPVDGECLESKV